MMTPFGDRAPIEVALLCNLPIGVLAWCAPDPCLTVIVKATFTLHEDGKARLADQQEPLVLDQQSAIAEPGDLDRPSDFVPFKANTDVLLSGNAYAASPATVIDVGFAVDGLKKRFHALAAEPSFWVPLLPAYLRSSRSSESEAIRVGARAIWARYEADGSLLSTDGLPAGPLPKGFDYGIFNVAPPDQQSAILSTSAQIVLDGLTADGLRRTVKLPGIRPRTFALGARGSAKRAAPQEIALRCDTLWIDGGLGLCTLTWRGLYVPVDGALPLLLLAMDERDAPLSLSDVKRRLGDAVISTAVTPDQLREISDVETTTVSDRDSSGTSPSSLAAVAPEQRDSASSRYVPTLKLGDFVAPLEEHTGDLDAVALNRAIDAALPFEHEKAKPQAVAPFALGGSRLAATMLSTSPPPAPPPPAQPPELPAQRPSLKNARTLPISPSLLESKRTLPFVAPPPEEPPAAPRAERPSLKNARTILIAQPPLEPARALPFSPPGAPAPEPAAPELPAPEQPVARPSLSSARTLPIDPRLASSSPALPFAPVIEPPAPVVPSAPPLGPPMIGPAPAASRWAPVIASPAPPSKPPPEPSPAPEPTRPKVEIAPEPPATPLLPIEAYAELKAAIWGEGLPLAVVLERHGVDQDTWYENERRLSRALAAEAKTGSKALALELREALRRARDRPPPDGDRPLGSIDSYLSIRAAVESASDPVAALASRGITAAEWHRMNLRIKARAEGDPALRSKLGKKLVVLRAAQGTEPTTVELKRSIRRERPPAGARRTPVTKRA